jgi:hypothetical protein
MAFRHDPDGRFDSFSHDVEMTARGLALLADAVVDVSAQSLPLFGNLRFDRRAELLHLGSHVGKLDVDATKASIDARQALINASEALLNASEALVDASKALVDAPESFDNCPMQVFKCHRASSYHRRVSCGSGAGLTEGEYRSELRDSLAIVCSGSQKLHPRRVRRCAEVDAAAAETWYGPARRRACRKPRNQAAQIEREASRLTDAARDEKKQPQIEVRDKPRASGGGPEFIARGNDYDSVRTGFANNGCAAVSKIAVHPLESVKEQRARPESAAPGDER